MDGISQVNERQSGPLQVLLIQNIQIRQEVYRLEMFSDHSAKLCWNVLGFLFDTAMAVLREFGYFEKYYNEYFETLDEKALT